MFKVKARDILYDADVLRSGTGGAITLRFVDGVLEATVLGISIANGGVSDVMLASGISFSKLPQTLTQSNVAETISAIWNFQSYLPTVSANPSAANQLARKAYVDSLLEGIRLNVSATVHADEDTEQLGFPEIDGYQTVAGDVVFVSNQDSDINNGIYIIGVDGTWTRDLTLTAGAQAAGVRVWINEGTVYAGTCFICDSPTTADTVGTHNLVFSQYPVLNQLVAGEGLDKTGNELSVLYGNGLQITSTLLTLKLNGSSLALSSSGISVASAGITHTHISNVAFGNGIAGGSGTTIALTTLTASWDLGGEHTITGVPNPVDDDDVANKAYVDTCISGVAGLKVWTHIVSAGEATAKEVILPATPALPAKTVLIVRGAPGCYLGVDFTINENALTWSGFALDGRMEASMAITVLYE